MIPRASRAATGATVRATYHASHVPGLYACTLVDEGPPRARTHDRLLLMTLAEGEAVVRCRGEEHLLRPGSVLLIEPGDVHRDMRKCTYRAVMVIFHSELVEAFRGRAVGPHLGRVVMHSPALSAHLLALFASVRDRSSPHDQEARAAALFRELRPLWTRKSPAPEAPLVARVRRALDEMRGASLSLRELAARFRCTPSYLCRAFSEQLAVGPHAYQILQRLLQARRLLEARQTNAATAHLAGFNDESHLRRHFRRRFAAAPGRYKEELILAV